MDYSQTLSEIVARLHKLGDLPVFSATVNQIRQISSSDEADAMALAMAVMKDVNLSVRVLKLSNTPMFNPKNKQIASLSRAVVLLGFERILNLAMTIKLVESLRGESEDKNLDNLLVQAFLNASIARELAEVAQLRKAEGVYLNGLLHNLGEILVAYTLPERYQKIQSNWRTEQQSWSKAQLNQLGAEFSDIGQEFASSWGFPKSLVQSMDKYTANKLVGRDRSAHQIAVGSSAILAKLYSRGEDEGQSLGKIIAKLSEQLDVQTEKIEDSVHQAYKLAAHLAEEVGVSTSSLKPIPSDDDDEQLDEFAQEISFYLHSRDQKNKAERPAVPTPSLQVSQVGGGLIDALSAYNQLLRADAPATKLVEEALKSVIANSGIEIGVFFIVSGKPCRLTARIIEGADAQRHQSFFDAQTTSPTARLLQRVCEKGSSLLVSDTASEQWQGRLPAEMLEQTGARGFILSGLSVNSKPLGLIYFAGQSTPLSDTDYAVFNQFMLLLKNALEGRARSAG